MDLVNLMYRYINRFINALELLDELQKIDLNGYSLNEQTEIKKLVKEVQKIKDTTPNEVDDVERNRIAHITHILESLNDVENSDLSDNAKEFIQKKKDQLLKDKDATYDGGALYQKVFDLLTQNELVGKYARGMNDLELLEFITKYISVPMPPVLTQDEFDKLVQVGIAHDMREALWRLAFNYNRKGIDFTLIEDYFLEVKDDYYLTELISAVEEDLNRGRLLKKLVDTCDKEFITNAIKEGYRIGIFSEDEVKEMIQMGVEKKLLTFKEAEGWIKKLDKR